MLKRSWNDFVCATTHENAELYLWGAGANCRELLRCFDMPRYRLSAIIDNNKNIIGTMFHGYPVISFDQLKSRIVQKKEIVIVVTCAAFLDVKQQLKGLDMTIFFHTDVFGNYVNALWGGNSLRWDKALSLCQKGYEDKIILDKVGMAIKKVQSHEAVFERDSVLFYEEEYNFPLLAALLYIANKERHLSVIDFGGSLGSTYFQNRNVLSDFQLDWHVIEQKEFVNYGIRNIHEEGLSFHYNIREVPSGCNCLLISNSLQYVDTPYQYLESLLTCGAQYIVFDAVPLWNRDDCVKIQKVPAEIYQSEYPVWILNKSKFSSVIEKNKKKIFSWNKPGLYDNDLDERLVEYGALYRTV